LIQDLGGNNEGLKVAAAQELGKLRERNAVTPLVKLLTDPSVPVQLAAINALAEIKDLAAVEPLCATIEREHSLTMKKAAAVALGRLQDSRAVGVLIKYMRLMPDEAEDSLVSIGEPSVAPLIVNLDDSETQDPSVGALIRIGSPAVAPLIQELRETTSSSGHFAAIRALSEIDDDRAAAAVNEALKSQDPKLVVAAYRFLIRNGRVDSEETLVRTLKLYGDLGMASDFRSSGNPLLKAKAEEWIARKYGKLTGVAPSESGLVWGKARDPVTQLALFHFDNSFASTSRVEPVMSTKASFVPGRFGSGVTVAKDGVLSYPLQGIWDLNTGTVEMWVASRFDGANAIFSKLNHALLLYTAANGDQFIVASSTSGGFYAGSVVKGRFAGTGGGVISDWRVGDWHHVAFSYSAENERQRFYIDGTLVAEGRSKIPLPPLGAATFTVNSDPGGNESAFVLDELRISKDEKVPEAIRVDADRIRPFTDNEVYRPRAH